MEKKYSFFISSTYEDLKEERDAVIHTVLTLGQFPVGMEMFSAMNMDQWKVIKKSIDSCDYYILIIGNKYGSIDEESGLSYTEKEFDYAISQGIPVLAFIANDNISLSVSKVEQDAEKIIGLRKFKDKVKNSHLYVSFWDNKDKLEALVSQSISKSILNSDRPGWIRCTDNIAVLNGNNENSELIQHNNERKPNLWVEVKDGIDNANLKINEKTINYIVAPVVTSDIMDGITYKGYFGQKVHKSKEEIESIRYMYENAISLDFIVHNDGNIKATDVRIKVYIPDGLALISEEGMDSYYDEMDYAHTEKAYHNHCLCFYNPDNMEADFKNENRVKTIKQLISTKSISEFLDNYLEFSDTSNNHFKEILHKDSRTFNVSYLVPIKPGEFKIKYELICNEYEDVISDEFTLVIE